MGGRRYGSLNLPPLHVETFRYNHCLHTSADFLPETRVERQLTTHPANLRDLKITDNQYLPRVPPHATPVSLPVPESYFVADHCLISVSVLFLIIVEGDTLERFDSSSRSRCCCLPTMKFFIFPI